jgi:hypothetical protein
LSIFAGQFQYPMRYFAWLVLLLQLNTTLFFPSRDEVDRYDLRGVMVDEINSILELVDEVVLGHTDPTPEDEDDDTAHYSRVIAIDMHIIPPTFVVVLQPYVPHVGACEQVLQAFYDESGKTLFMGDVPYSPPEQA